MDVISYDKEETDSEFIRKFKKNPQLTKLTKYISKLSDQYNKYKGKYVFPLKYKGMNNFKFPPNLVNVIQNSILPPNFTI